MSQKDNDVSRRTVLKKGAAVATVAAGGVAATSGSATAADYDYLRVQGQGDFRIEVSADNIEVSNQPVDLTITEKSDGFWILEGTVDGEINSTPDDYAQFMVYGFSTFGSRSWDDGVETFWQGYKIAES